MSILRQKTIAALSFGAFLCIVISTLALLGVFKVWQAKFTDILQGGRPVSKDIVIVAVDESSINAENMLGSYDTWDRNHFAQVLENINQYNPRIVAFDFFFKAPKKEQGDLRFRDALAAANHPVIFYNMNPSTYDSRGFFVQESGFALNPLPLQLFREIANITISTAKAFHDDDNIIRRVMPFIFNQESGKYYENFPFAIARLALNGEQKPSQPVITPHRYVVHLQNGDEFQIPLENGQMIINFASIPITKSYQRVSFIDVYKGNFQDYDSNPEKLFGDKIVLVGPTAIDFRDFYDAPTSGGKKMSGVEIHANALQTILDRAFLHNMTLFETVILIAIFALLSSFVFMFTKISWSLLYLAMVPTVYTAITPVAFTNGLIPDLIHPYMALVTVFIAVYMYRYFTEFKEKMALRGAFSKYVNPTVAQQIAEHPEQLKLGGEKREVTVLFSDIAHFTSISEQLKPESLVTLLNEYLEAMSEVIMAEGGTVDKFEGDAVMAFFGAPLPQPDHAVRACRTALNMRVKLDELLAKWQNDPPLPGGEKKPMIDFRCGLSSGEVIVGNIGSARRIDYTVMGDVVNLGSRLEGANKKYDTRIMMSEATFETVKDQFEARELDTIRVVGKSQPSKVYELLNFKGQLVPEAAQLLTLYNEGIKLYHERKFAEGLAKFEEIIKIYPQDGPSKLYKQRCEVFRDYPPAANWDGVFEMGSK